MQLHIEAAKYPNGVFLELGTDRGQGSRAILSACETNGLLVSVDIRDCSNALMSPNWKFVQADSTDRETIVKAAPRLLEGIDLIYVDSLHTPEHVTKEIFTWFDLLKPGGVMFFDDVDSGPYFSGARKDSPIMEIANRKIRETIENIAYANIENVDLSVIYGSTGLAVLRKCTDLSLRKPSNSSRRYSLLWARIMRRFGRNYQNKGDGSDHLIPLP